jgi:hypothetical protein
MKTSRNTAEHAKSENTSIEIHNTFYRESLAAASLLAETTLKDLR